MPTAFEERWIRVRGCGQEGIAVGPGPGTVCIGIGVVRHPGAHLRDHLVNTHATPVEQHLRPAPCRLPSITAKTRSKPALTAMAAPYSARVMASASASRSSAGRLSLADGGGGRYHRTPLERWPGNVQRQVFSGAGAGIAPPSGAASPSAAMAQRDLAVLVQTAKLLCDGAIAATGIPHKLVQQTRILFHRCKFRDSRGEQQRVVVDALAGTIATE